jgi:DNA-binding transcriptional LysR family regulator
VPSGRYSSDNSSIIRQAAVNGIGICLGPSWIFRDDLSEGRLKEILKTYGLEPYEIFVIRPAVDDTPLRIKVMTEYLAHEFSLNTWLK